MRIPRCPLWRHVTLLSPASDDTTFRAKSQLIHNNWLSLTSPQDFQRYKNWHLISLFGRRSQARPLPDGRVKGPEPLFPTRCLFSPDRCRATPIRARRLFCRLRRCCLCSRHPEPCAPQPGPLHPGHPQSPLLVRQWLPVCCWGWLWLIIILMIEIP